MLQLIREICSYTYPPLSIARYSFYSRVNWSNVEWTNLPKLLTLQHRVRTWALVVESPKLYPWSIELYYVSPIRTHVCPTFDVSDWLVTWPSRCHTATDWLYIWLRDWCSATDWLETWSRGGNGRSNTGNAQQIEEGKEARKMGGLCKKSPGTT